MEALEQNVFRNGLKAKSGLATKSRGNKNML